MLVARDMLAANEASKFMTTHYKGKSVLAQCNYCTNCLKGGNPQTLFLPASGHVKSCDWAKLFENSILDPYQTMSAFSPMGSLNYMGSLLTINEQGPLCNKPMCVPKCFLCFSEIDTNGVSPENFGPLQAHKACCRPCSKLGCKEWLPTMPAYFSTAVGFSQPSLCSKHSVPASKPLRLITQPANVVEPVKKHVVPDEPAVKKPPPSKKQKKSKTSAFNNDKSSHLITKFIAGGDEIEEKKRKKEEAMKEAQKVQEEPKHFLHNKKTSEIFAYVKDGKAYHIKTDKFLFELGQNNNSSSATGSSRVAIGGRKFDFKPPSKESRHPLDVDMLLTEDCEVEAYWAQFVTQEEPSGTNIGDPLLAEPLGVDV